MKMNGTTITIEVVSMKTSKWLYKYIKPYVPMLIFAFTLTIVNTVLSNLKPLIQGEPLIQYKNGIPLHLNLFTK